jgi:cytochrome c2
MPDQRKYIIWAFLICVVVFAVIYFAMSFNSTKSSSGYSGIVDDNKFLNQDTNRNYINGKILFQNKCAACHMIHLDATGPDLAGVTQRGPWTNKENIYDFLKNPRKFELSNKYMQELRKKYPGAHPVFSMDDKDVDAILRYIE